MADGMGPCTCGHAPEEHRDEEHECSGTYMYEGKEEKCLCGMYEEDEDFDPESK